MESLCITNKISKLFYVSATEFVNDAGHTLHSGRETTAKPVVLTHAELIRNTLW